MSGSISMEKVSFSYDEKKVFSELSLSLPGGVTTLVGQNGTGKSTFLLLAGGRLMPETGSVKIDGLDTRTISDESERNKLVSFIFQNMEFETEENVGELLDFVGSQGPEGSSELIPELVKEFSLDATLNKKFQENSKGDMQKICIAFSLLYGSPYIMMDEPVFALDHKWKERVLSYLKDFAAAKEISLFYSIHELELSRKYSDNSLLFFKDGSLSLGPTSALLARESVEEAYQVPMELLYQRETLYREHLVKPLETDDLSGQNVKVID